MTLSQQRQDMTEAAREQLRELMSEISEELWCAGWLDGLEYSLWIMVEGGDRRFGMGEVTEQEAQDLRRLSAEAGGWWVWKNDTDGEVFLTTEEWNAVREEGRP